jgi:hypothetical protein
LKDNLAANLQRVISMIAGSGDHEMLHIADALKIWIGGTDSVRLEDAFGVAGNWRSARRRHRRDEIYIEIARTNFPDLTGVPLARAIAAAIGRYEASSWRFDRDNGRRPAGLNGLVFDLLALGGRRLDVEALRKLPGIFRAGEYQNQDLRFGEQVESCLEYDGTDKSVFQGSESE